MNMVKAVGARTIGWMYRAAITPGVMAWMVALLLMHCVILPQGSAIGGFLRICLEGGRMHCFFPDHIRLVPDARGGWSIDEEGQTQGPGVIEVVFGVRRWSVGIASPTRRCTYRFLQVYDTGTMAQVTLPPAAAATVRKWFAYPQYVVDFDEALAGRMGASEPITAGYVQNAVLGAQVLGIAWCMVAREFAKAKRNGDRRRRAMGLCVGCGYPVFAAGDACPECGREYLHEDQLPALAPPVLKSWDEIGGGAWGSR